MATADKPTSMNQASERDPQNNNSYGTLVDSDYVAVDLPILDAHDFNERIIHAYEEGNAEKGLPADLRDGIPVTRSPPLEQAGLEPLPQPPQDAVLLVRHENAVPGGPPVGSRPRLLDAHVAHFDGSDRPANAHQ